MRIMTSNIWGDYFGNTVDVRIDDIYGIYKKYDPDILGLQEITKRWYESGLFERLAEEYAWVGTEIADSNNFVPFCYKKSYKLIAKGYEYLVETPDVTKGITWAVLKAEDEKLFAVCNTHFWWRTGPEHDEIRVKNAHQLVRLMKYLKELYNCPVFAFGDMNTTLSSDVFEVYSQNGIKHLHDLADQKDNMSSHHGDPVCGEDGKYHGKKTENDKSFSIDHMIVLDDKVKVSQYRIIEDQPALDATDHSPVFCDVEF